VRAPGSWRRRAEARPLLALLATALLAIGVAACGGTGKGAGSTSQLSSNAAGTGGARTKTASNAARAGNYLKSDGDTDIDDTNHQIEAPESDDTLFLAAYGKKAGQAEKRAVAVVLERYYAAAAADDGAKACPLLYSSLATALVEDQGQSPRSSSKTCAAVLSKLFTQQHARLAAENTATMVVIDVRVKSNYGLAVLGFKAAPVSQMILARERGAWKIDGLFDSQLT
jgi:hypothetical protein